MNEVAFDDKQVENGALLDFVKSLLDIEKQSDRYFFDIRISTDGCTHSVAWCQRYYDFDDDERFALVNPGMNEKVMRGFELPDGQTVYLEKQWPQYELKEVIESYEEEHPNWKYDAINEQWQHIEGDKDNRKG